MFFDLLPSASQVLCNKNNGYKHVILGYILSLLDCNVFCRFGTKMGLSPQLSVCSHGFEVTFFRVAAPDTSFLNCEAALSSILPLVYLFHVKSFFSISQIVFFELDHPLVLTGSITVTKMET